ncbi:hypothetical protein HN51_007529 [Arachis hypogaea]|uniref:Membrane-associated kinase regulator 1 n=2 Tax=Arachis TaxID=3817 RepID=A0A445D849_ARAHY|nr:probable membrane-associated kinase regulator 1 [Arachis duranensis]XP_025699673.1 probable membrane-associated kinase regulator 1 [Arachis hypogaea]QHO41680.1 putative membrane-associated kinase regulator [Arachis hypogaea]RYR59154.1 hypothetical protein Ahy_A05g024989 [Arachis hypogaea]
MASGRRRALKDSSSTKSKSKSYTLPSSPSHSFSSSSSSDFEFTISISPRKSSAALCPADELFYKGQLLPLHLSPRISMVRTLLLSSPSSSSSAAARDSTGSTTSTNSSSSSSFASDLALFPDCDSSRPSSVTDDDELKRLHNPSKEYPHSQIKKNHPNRYFSFSRFSSVFRKDTTTTTTNKVCETEHHHHVAASSSSSSVKRMSATARDVIRKYLKKVKPLYEKLSQKQQRTGELLAEGGGASVNATTTTSSRTVLSLLTTLTERSKTEGGCSGKRGMKENVSGVLSHSFSGNLRYPRKRRSCVSSCPSSMRSSPSHSGVLSQGGARAGMHFGDSSSMEELQSAIQGAITHCKNSLMQNKLDTGAAQ